jgi:hypothetical protein
MTLSISADGADDGGEPGEPDVGFRVGEAMSVDNGGEFGGWAGSVALTTLAALTWAAMRLSTLADSAMSRTASNLLLGRPLLPETRPEI